MPLFCATVSIPEAATVGPEPPVRPGGSPAVREEHDVPVVSLLDRILGAAAASCEGEVPEGSGSRRALSGLCPPRRCHGAANRARAAPRPAPRSLRESSPTGDA